MLWRESGPQEASALSASDLKICELCGALNMASNRECFVCRWRGRFERRADIVRLAIELAERHYGRLEPWLVAGGPAFGAGPRRRFLGRLAHGVRRAVDWLRG